MESSQKGIIDMFAECIEQVDPELRPLLLRNVVVTGGTSLLPGLFERISDELRSIVDCSINLNIWHATDPLFYVRKLASASRKSDYADTVITKKKYEEYGSIAIAEYFKL